MSKRNIRSWRRSTLTGGFYWTGNGHWCFYTAHISNDLNRSELEEIMHPLRIRFAEILLKNPWPSHKMRGAALRMMMRPKKVGSDWLKAPCIFAYWLLTLCQPWLFDGRRIWDWRLYKHLALGKVHGGVFRCFASTIYLADSDKDIFIRTQKTDNQTTIKAWIKTYCVKMNWLHIRNDLKCSCTLICKNLIIKNSLAIYGICGTPSVWMRSDIAGKISVPHSRMVFVLCWHIFLLERLHSLVPKRDVVLRAAWWSCFAGTYDTWPPSHFLLLPVSFLTDKTWNWYTASKKNLAVSKNHPPAEYANVVWYFMCTQMY